jgi:DNA-binding transcriptional MerR regulator
MKAKVMSTLPSIPNKRYFTIGEVSTLCAVKPHVLRYWEQEFQVLRPSKRRGNRRYYRLEDVLVVRQIKTLLYDEGYTISGARNVLKTPASAPVETPSATPDKLSNLIKELEEVIALL